MPRTSRRDRADRSSELAHEVAAGSEPADLVVRGGRTLDVRTGEFDRQDVVVAEGEIVEHRADATPVVGPDTEVIDADDGVVIPGFVDAHTHLDLHQTVEGAAHRSLAGGTTAMVSEVAGFGPAFGAAGVEQLLAATANLAVSVYVTVPPQPLFDAFEPPRADETAATRLSDLLGRDRVVGVGETAWSRIVGRETPATRLYDRAETEGKRVVGHGAGCRGDALTEFAATVDDDHEAISDQGVVERLDRGLHVIGRSGSIRDDIAAVAGVDHEPGSLSLSSDGMWPRDLVADGHMDAVVRRAVEAGMDPVAAVRAATWAPATHYELTGHGTLAPGSRADLVVLDDLSAVSVATTVVDGEVVYDGTIASTPGPRSHAYPDWFSGRLDVTVDAERLSVPADRAVDGGVRALEYTGGILSTETTVRPIVEDGQLRPAPDRDILKTALFDRHPDVRRDGFVGFLTGIGIERGAVATTLTWETPGLLAAGVDDSDIVTAARRVVETNGGWAVVEDGETLATLPTPVGHVCSRLPVEETAERYEAVETALFQLGAEVDRPMLGLQSLTFVGVPGLKLGVTGYVDVRNKTTRGLDPSDDE